jgi:ATP dependent DNA ligase domain
MCILEYFFDTYRAYEFENLMVVFFDVLLIDHDPILTRNYDERRSRLEALIAVSLGRAELAFRQEICFSSRSAISQLREAFAKGIASRWEGFVLKPCDDPYFIWRKGAKEPMDFKGCWIKLKKDYINGMGDDADFAVVGASYDCKRAQSLTGTKRLRWTTFYIACLENKIDIMRFGSKPRYKVVDALSETIRTEDIQTLNEIGQFRSKAFDKTSVYEEGDFEVDPRLKCVMSVYFTTPFIVEVVGGGYERLSNTTHWTLRWPRVTKIQWDRTSQDTTSFVELQECAEKAVNRPIDGADDDEAWLDLLERVDLGKKGAADAVLDATSAELVTLHAASAGLARKRRYGESPTTDLVRVDARDQLLDGYPTKRAKRANIPQNEPISPLAISREHALRGLEVCEFRERNIEDSDFDFFHLGPLENASSPLLSNSPSVNLAAPLTDIINSSCQRRPSRLDSSCRVDGSVCLRGSQDTRKPTGGHSSAAIPNQNSNSTTFMPWQAPQIASDPPKLGTGVCARCPRTVFRSSGFTTELSPSPTVPAVCPLKNTIILLSSCVIGMSHLTEDLLTAHGATFFPVSEFEQATMDGQIGERTRKLILVEGNRYEATKKAIRAVKELRLDGERIEMYDWRLLEEVAKYEKGERADVEWRKYLICEV